MPARDRSGPASLARKTDEWFERAKAALLSQTPCRAGCSHCCIGMFPLTRLDADLIRDGLAQLPAEQQAGIRRRASQQVRALEDAYPELQGSRSLEGWEDVEIDRVVNDFQDDPCPALREDGLCAVYAYRPLACRSMGIPTDSGTVVNGACGIQTFVPIVRLPESLRAEEEKLAGWEAEMLRAHPRAAEGEEMFLPYGFLQLDDRPPATPSKNRGN